MASLVVCFSCGCSLPLIFAQKVRVARKSVTSQASEPARNFRKEDIPFYPELSVRECPPGVLIRDDGSTHVCPFCLTLLESHFEQVRAKGYFDMNISLKVQEEWRRVLRQFKCTVCGMETYRKRVRLLPIQKFLFLESRLRSQRYMVINLDEMKCAVVCLDCSETLWIQNDEYDRFKLPLTFRHFNWFSRSPPPEGSEEAELARLPSGIAKYPRRTLMETLCIERVAQTVTLKSSMSFRQTPTRTATNLRQASESSTWLTVGPSRSHPNLSRKIRIKMPEKTNSSTTLRNHFSHGMNRFAKRLSQPPSCLIQPQYYYNSFGTQGQYPYNHGMNPSSFGLTEYNNSQISEALVNHQSSDNNEIRTCTSNNERENFLSGLPLKKRILML